MKRSRLLPMVLISGFLAFIIFGQIFAQEVDEKISEQEFADFLRKEVIGNPALSLSASYYIPGPELDWGKVSQLINEKKFSAIWNSKKRKDISQKLLNCKNQKGCGVCRMTSFNEVLLNLRNVNTKNFI